MTWLVDHVELRVQLAIETSSFCTAYRYTACEVLLWFRVWAFETHELWAYNNPKLRRWEVSLGEARSLGLQTRAPSCSQGNTQLQALPRRQTHQCRAELNKQTAGCHPVQPFDDMNFRMWGLKGQGLPCRNAAVDEAEATDALTY